MAVAAAGRSSPRNEFLPRADRGRDLSRRMAVRLGKSISHVAERAAEVCKVNRPAVDRLALVVAQNGRPPPEICGLHSALLAAADNNDVAAVESLLEEAANFEAPPAGLRIQGFSAHQLGERHYRRVRGFIAADPTSPVNIAPPDPVVEARMKSRVLEALAVLDRADPELGGETRSIVSTIYLGVTSDPDEQKGFDGFSSFEMWGAITLNALRHTDAVDTATSIAHETAHLVLFAEALHEPLVLNDASEMFPSPLRSDLRPMDGIYHATFVVARTHLVLERIAASNQFPRFARSIAANMHSLKVNFAEGLGTVARHAQLTDTGRRLIDAATSYMSNAA